MATNTLKIDGSWEPELIKIEATMVLKQSAGKMLAEIRDFDSTKIDTFSFEDEIEIYDGAVKLWGGYLTDKKYKTEKRQRLEISADDYSILLKNRIIAKIYVTDSAGDPADDTGQVSNIVEDLLTMFPEFTTDITATDKILDRFVLDYISVKDAITKLANMVGSDWVITPAKVFTFKPKTTITAASETLVWGTNILRARKEKTIRDVHNQVIVIGGTEVTNTSDTFSGDGATKEFDLSQPPRNPLNSVTVDAGAKTEFTDYDVNYRTGRIVFATAPTNNANNVVIDYDYDKTITAEAYSAHADYSKRRTKKVFDRAIGTRSLAQDYADALVDDMNDPKNIYIINATKTPNTRIKQYITVTIPKYSLSASDLEVVSWKFTGPRKRYEFILSNQPYETAEFLGEQASEIKEMQRQSGDAIVTYKAKADTLALSEAKNKYTRARNDTFILGLNSAGTDKSLLGATDGAGGVPDKLGDRHGART